LSAAEKNDEDVVKLLLETGKMDLEFKDGNGRTPLVRAVEGESVAVVRLLLAEGVKTDYKNNIVAGSSFQRPLPSLPPPGPSRFNTSMILANTNNLDYCRK
jgi:ankyrin repeat protein